MNAAAPNRLHSTAQSAPLSFLLVPAPGPWVPGLGAGETPALGVGDANCSSISGLSLGGIVGRWVSGRGVGSSYYSMFSGRTASKNAAGLSGAAGVTSTGIHPVPPQYTSTQAWAL